MENVIAFAGGVAGIDDDRQMRPARGDGDAGDIQGISDGVLEGLDAALAEHDVAIALAEDVFGGEEPVFDGRGQAALEEDGLSHFADLAEEVEILHVAGADLEAIDVFFHCSTWRVSMTSTQMGMPSSSPHSRIHWRAGIPSPWKE